ncbi:MAG: SGNH/GDSL hydrolase family protein [Armatimonadetes bacterium]|nr:SGNH/GDSL hydrolase family protein [Armatimonadota bacterium]
MAQDQFEAPPPPDNLTELGKNIQRTMTLLATSTPERRHTVRILFYGQSVTAGKWSYALADDLRKQYPNANLTIENRAIGGYGAESLVKTADYDLYPFYPDLTIYHCWGGVKNGQQEEIIKRLRQRTTSEVLLWTTHFRFDPNLPRETPLNDPKLIARTQDDEERVALWKELAVKYGCEIAEVRERLRVYLKAHDLYPKDTLADSVHPNALGNFLIRKLIAPSLRYDPSFPPDPWKNLVTTVPVADARVTQGAGGALKLSFDGNRIDVISDHVGGPRLGTAKVLLDGQPPSANPDLYYHSRPTAAPNVWWPSINQFGHEKPLVCEKWMLKLTECDVEKKVLKFAVEGSVTGPDGEGDASQRFVSNSGRVIIEPSAWSVMGALTYSKKPVPEGYVVTWETRPLFVDTYQAPSTPDAALEYATNLAMLMSNGPHTIELIPNGDGAVPVEGFRFYTPPVK